MLNPTPVFYLWWLAIDGLTGLAEYYFLTCFTEKASKKGLPLYLLAVPSTSFLCMALSLSRPEKLALHLGLLLFSSHLFLHLSWKNTVSPAAIAITVSSFREGFLTVVLRYLSTHVTSPVNGLFLQIAVTLVSTLLLFLAYRLLGKRYASMAGHRISPYLYALLIPCSFFILTLENGAGFNTEKALAFPPPTAYQTWITLAWLAGAFLIFLIFTEFLFRIIRLSDRQSLDLLRESQSRAQQIYLKEARARNEEYRSLEHDITNHLLVLKGLLKGGKTEKALEYSEKLCSSWQSVSPPLATGHPVLDILLHEKLEFARQSQIRTDCFFQLPKDLPIDDTDLAILFFNALDNAVAANLKLPPKERSLAISVKVKQQFLLIEIRNPMIPCGSPVSYGTGLKNILQTAKKYAGTMETETENGSFRLTLLLCLSR